MGGNLLQKLGEFDYSHLTSILSGIILPVKEHNLCDVDRWYASLSLKLHSLTNSGIQKLKLVCLLLKHKQLEALRERKSSLGVCTQRAQIFTRSVHSESANLRQGNSVLPKFNGSLLVPSSIFPENLIEICS